MSTKSRFSGGEGTESNPYQSANIDDFEAIRDQAAKWRNGWHLLSSYREYYIDRKVDTKRGLQ